MEEYFDVVDEKGIPTGETVSRSVAHATGVRHRTAHVWIMRRSPEGGVQVLLQKRSQNKDSFPGEYDTSSAGHIQAGDEPLESALRELEEELGIKGRKEDLCPVGTFEISYQEEFHGKPFVDEEIAFVFIYLGEVEAEKLTLQEDEIDSVRWFSFEEIREGMAGGHGVFCVPPGGLALVEAYAREHYKD